MSVFMPCIFLQITLLLLKITNSITWNWYIVLSPLIFLVVYTVLLSLISLVIKNYSHKPVISFWWIFQITVIILKLANQIDWSWPIVLIPTIVAVLMLVAIIIAALIISFIHNMKK